MSHQKASRHPARQLDQQRLDG